jgi:hypothetical protein
MRKLIIGFILAAISITTHAADYTYLTIVEQDGTKTSLTAVGLTITFSDGNLVATNSTTSESKTISLSNLASMNFSTANETTTGIQNVSIDIDDADTFIYDLSGRQIPSGGSLTKGIYIIKKGSVTRKIQVK